MGAQAKAYFFATPKSSLYDRFSKNNLPTEANFRNLFDSVPFKLEVGDTASAAQQGLVKLVSDANAKTRTSVVAGQMIQVVQPHQLPMLMTGSTEVVIGAETTDADNGIKITGVEKGATGFKRLSYKVELDVASLDTISLDGLDVNADYVAASIGGVTCKILISELITGYNLWSRATTVLSPTTANDSIDLGTGDMKAGSFTLSNDAAIAYITTEAKAAGVEVKIIGGSASSGTNVGGAVYLYGGAGYGGGISGNTYLNWNGSSAVGYLGIGGAIDTGYAYRAKLTGSLWVTGTIKHGLTAGGGGAVPAGAAPYVLTSDAVGLSPSFKQFMDGIVGATLAAKAIIYFDGSAYTYIATGATADKYLLTGLAGTPSFGDLDLTAKVGNASFSGDGIIALARLVPLTASNIITTDVNGVLQASGVASTKLTYINTITSDIQVQLDALKATSGGNSIYYTTGDYTISSAELYSTIVAECSTNTIDVTLPALADVPVGTIISVVKKFSTGSYQVHVNANAADAIMSLASAEVTAVAMTGITGTVTRYQAYNSSIWHEIV